MNTPTSYLQHSKAPPYQAALGTQNRSTAHDDSNSENIDHLIQGLNDVAQPDDVTLTVGTAIDGNLLEAVTTAASRHETNQREEVQDSVTHPSILAKQALSSLGPGNGGNKRKHSQDEDGYLHSQTLQDVSYSQTPTRDHLKRHKSDEERELDALHEHQRIDRSPMQTPLTVPNPNLTSNTDKAASFFVNEYRPNTRLNGTNYISSYSAAALFRKPTSASSKYTRPPMSKLFASLEMSPESFIDLQALAKTFMLDPTQPERQDCVGSRGKSDSDMVKLKLFHCVKDFLDEGDTGNQYFGKDSEGVDRRDWYWPRDVNKVIAIVTPLMRRMVTNERQRQYAVSSRSGRNADGDTLSNEDNSKAIPSRNGVYRHKKCRATDSAPDLTMRLETQLDPLLGKGDVQISASDTGPNAQPSTDADTLRLRICIIGNNEEPGREALLVPPITYLLSISRTSFRSLLAYIASLLVPDILSSPLPNQLHFKALLPRGLVELEHNGSNWHEIVEEVKNTSWLESNLRIVAEIDSAFWP